MPQVTVYIRAEDITRWKTLEKKSEFIHNALNGVPMDIHPEGHAQPSLRYPTKTPNSGIPPEVIGTKEAKIYPNYNPPTNLPVIKTIKDAEKAVGPGDITPFMRKIAQSPYTKLCKIHGTLLDSRGRCLQKGCKYS